MKKRKHSGLGILIVLFVLVFTITYAYSNYASNKNAGSDKVAGLNSKNEPEASRIYNRIMSYELDKVYPQTAEDVMRLYNDTVHIMYGDMIADEELMKNVLSQQRKLCSAELINDMSIDEQYINLVAALSLLMEQGSICVGVEQKIVKYDPEDSLHCTISVVSNYTKGLSVYRNYNLYKNESSGRWEIYNWEQTDENFNIKT